MAACSVVDSPDGVDYTTMCCVQTTDGVYYTVPKEYFRLNANLARRKLSTAEPFAIPLDRATCEPFFALLEKVCILSTAALDNQVKGANEERAPWMRNLNKRQLKFVDMSLGVTSWDGKDIPFYENALPKINDVVWVKITQVNDTSAVVQLLEYGKREGIIPYTEVTRNRVRSMGKLIKIGRSEAVQVIRMDKDKGYIDLSKKQVTPKEAKACKANYRKGSDVRSVVCHVAEECDMSSLEAMQRIAFPLYRRQPGKHAWDWLYELNRDQNVDEILGPLHLEQNVIDALLAALRNAMRKKIVTLHARVDITCFTFDGVEAVRKVLLLGRNYGADKEPHIPLAVTIIGPPTYALRARTDMKEEGLLRIEEAIEAMKVEMAKLQGQLRVVVAPEVLGDDDKGNKNNYLADNDDDDDEDEDEDEDDY